MAAVSANGVIGKAGGLPWRLAADMARFKALTLGHPVIMGRSTWESLARRPLPGRTNIVLTRDAGFKAEGALCVSSLERALAVARAAPGGDAVKVIGGGKVYAQAMPLADRLDVTHVLAETDGDTRFPPIDPVIWEMVASEHVPAGPRDDHACLYAVYLRRTEK